MRRAALGAAAQLRNAAIQSGERSFASEVQPVTATLFPGPPFMVHLYGSCSVLLSKCNIITLCQLAKAVRTNNKCTMSTVLACAAWLLLAALEVGRAALLCY